MNQQSAVPVQFRNKILIQQVFKLKPGSTSSNNIDDRIIIKSFPCEVMCDELAQDQQLKLDSIFYHVPLMYYDETKTDCEVVVDYQNIEPNSKWDEMAPDSLTYSMYYVKEDVGCQHFVRGCQMLCNTCNKYYTCRKCHDEVEDHPFPRKETKMVKCIYCSCEQPFQQYCQNCNICFGEQWCELCRAFSNIGQESKPKYHCQGCDSCVGGHAHQWRHCDKCHKCVRVFNFENHDCHIFEDDCSVCLGSLNDSTYALIYLNCSHVIHQKCYNELIRQSETKCPVCRRFLPIGTEKLECLNFFKCQFEETVVLEPIQWLMFQCYECQRQFTAADASVVKCGKCQMYNVEVIGHGNEAEGKQEWNVYPNAKPKLCTEQEVGEILNIKYGLEYNKEWDLLIIGKIINYMPKTQEEFLQLLEELNV
ncbi:CHY_zinc finger domain-containing protein [Hexamita inflata]|uniref:CHY zinc finger domain-containing protein n=1 Tax=Hexamita inflata TaxID=28002 RepID=A0AA86QX74_9EUKA|nr:CHY zinc finger domain-containing protein [Hexamita inflata]